MIGKNNAALAAGRKVLLVATLCKSGKAERGSCDPCRGTLHKKIPAEMLGFILFDDETTIWLNGEFRFASFVKLQGHERGLKGFIVNIKTWVGKPEILEIKGKG